MDLPFDPPRAPTAQEGWITMVVEKDYREKMFGKKNRVIVKVRPSLSLSSIPHHSTETRTLSLGSPQLTSPSVPAYPRTISIPFHLSITVLAHSSHTSSSSSSPPDILVPPPSDLKILLIRHITTRARGATQSINQTVGLLADLKNETRVWKLPPVLREVGGEKRWAAEVVTVGEMAVGGAAGPSFGAGMTRGMLTCDVSSNPPPLPTLRTTSGG